MCSLNYFPPFTCLRRDRTFLLAADWERRCSASCFDSRLTWAPKFGRGVRWTLGAGDANPRLDLKTKDVRKVDENSKKSPGLHHMDICDVALFSVLIQVRAHQRCYKHYTAYINVGYFEAAREKFLQEVYIRSERKKKRVKIGTHSGQIK